MAVHIKLIKNNIKNSSSYGKSLKKNWPMARQLSCLVSVVSVFV